MSSNSLRNLSMLLHKVMDCLGFSPEAIDRRIKRCTEHTAFLNETCKEDNMEMVIAGSRSEGTASILDSDFDILMVLTNIICADDGYEKNAMYIFRKFIDQSPPGYTMLRLLNIDGTLPLNIRTDNDLVKDTVFLSSKDLLGSFYCVQQKHQDVETVETKISMNGPAICAVETNFLPNGENLIMRSSDYVFALRFYTSSFQKDWQQRKREHEWPPQAIIQKVSTLEGYVVPVGHSLSEDQNFEWRICYTKSEQILISSLKEKQKKLYVILKILKKDAFEPNVNCVNSYMLKNVVLWIAKCTPGHAFTPVSLIQMLMKCLFFLLHCLNNNFLPNYMIPRRNHFLGKVKSEHKQKLKLLLREMLNEKERVVLRCHKISTVITEMTTDPSFAKQLRTWRDELECLLFQMATYIFTSKNVPVLYHTSNIAAMNELFMKDKTCLCFVEKMKEHLSRRIFINEEDSLHEIIGRITELFQY